VVVGQALHVNNLLSFLLTVSFSEASPEKVLSAVRGFASASQWGDRGMGFPLILCFRIASLGRIVLHYTSILGISYVVYCRLEALQDSTPPINAENGSHCFFPLFIFSLPCLTSVGSLTR
jgi:hypothetical protein